MLCYAMLCYAMLCYAMRGKIRQISCFLAISIIFSVFQSFFSNFGSFLGSLGFIFRCFLNTDFAMFFLDHFCTNFKKGESMKSAQNTAPVHRFKGSPV